MEVRYLREHSDRTEDCERRGEDPVGHTRHHVAAARRDLVDAHRQRNAALAHPHELGGGKAVLVHEAAGVLQAHQHFVLRPGERQHRGHFLAQRRHRAGANVALEVEHEHPGTARAVLLPAGLRLALAGLCRRLAFPGAEESVLQDLLHPAVACAQIADFQSFGTVAAPLARHYGDDDDHATCGGHDCECFGQEQAVLQQVVEHRAVSRSESSPRILPRRGRCRAETRRSVTGPGLASGLGLEFGQSPDWRSGRTRVRNVQPAPGTFGLRSRRPVAAILRGPRRRGTRRRGAVRRAPPRRSPPRAAARAGPHRDSPRWSSGREIRSASRSSPRH